VSAAEIGAKYEQSESNTTIGSSVLEESSSILGVECYSLAKTQQNKKLQLF